MREPVLHAMNRFGLGRLGEEPLPGNAVAWLHDQIAAPDPEAATPGPNERDAIDVINRQDRFNDAKRADPNSHPENDPAIGPPMIGVTFDRDLDHTLRYTVRTALPVRERLVQFWTNHVSASTKAGGGVLAYSGAYVHDAIRPYATGRFVDLLRACLHHADLLTFYGTGDSVGPNSPFGLARGRGLNENFGRETLELFTLGVGSGYTQADVTAAARIFTGFSTERRQAPLGFRFRTDLHEPGPQVLLGRSFPAGEAGADELITFLGTHPATYRHIAEKLARHYISDTSPRHCIDRVAARLGATGGNIEAAMLDIIAQPEAWEPLTKLRSPVDHAIALYRALDITPEKGKDVFWTAYTMGEAFWAPPLVKGWPDTAADWTGGEALLRRADVAWRMAGRKDAPEALPLADRVLGGLLSEASRARIAAAPSRREALALVLASPEFMRR